MPALKNSEIVKLFFLLIYTSVLDICVSTFLLEQPYAHIPAYAVAHLPANKVYKLTNYLES